MKWLWIASAAGTMLSLWILWELVRSAVRRGILEAREHKGPVPTRSAAVFMLCFVLLVAAVIVTMFLS